MPLSFDDWLTQNTTVRRRDTEDGAVRYGYESTGDNPFRFITAGDNGTPVLDQLRAVYDNVLNATDSHGRARFGSDPFAGYSFNPDENWSGRHGAVMIGGRAFVRGDAYDDIAANPKAKAILDQFGVGPQHYAYSDQYGDVVPEEIFEALKLPLKAATRSTGFWTSLSDWLVTAPKSFGLAISGAAIGGAFAGVDAITGQAYAAGQSGLWNLATSQAPAPVSELTLNPIEPAGNATNFGGSYTGAELQTYPYVDPGTVNGIPLDPWVPGTPAWPTYEQLTGLPYAPDITSPFPAPSITDPIVDPFVDISPPPGDPILDALRAPTITTTTTPGASSGGGINPSTALTSAAGLAGTLAKIVGAVGTLAAAAGAVLGGTGKTSGAASTTSDLFNTTGLPSSAVSSAAGGLGTPVSTTTTAAASTQLALIALLGVGAYVIYSGK